MENYIKRDRYLKKLIDLQNNGEVKIITGPRRCGKSWLLSHIYRDYLLEEGVNESNIISVSLDIDSPENKEELSDSKLLRDYLHDRVSDDSNHYYIFLDEVQEVEGFEKIVNGLNAKDNVDVYITGSNSKFLSSDIRTIFRGRGAEIRVWPFSFKEFCTDRPEPINELWKEYYTYGGLPGLRAQKTPALKAAYLRRLWNKTYIDDVVERNHVRDKAALESLVNALCSSIGSLSNPSRMRNMLKSLKKINIDDETINDYLHHLEDAFLFEGCQRYNIKGNKYYASIKKYYSVDIGLRNALLNFRQQELTHIMENIIYTELRSRDFLVDVGVVELREMHQGKSSYSQLEIDFIATDGMEKYYIQSAYRMPDEEKREQEIKSLKKTGDSWRKIVIVGDDIATYTDDHGIIYIGLMQFLLNNKILE